MPRKKKGRTASRKILSLEVRENFKQYNSYKNSVFAAPLSHFFLSFYIVHSSVTFLSSSKIVLATLPFYSKSVEIITKFYQVHMLIIIKKKITNAPNGGSI